MHMNTVCVLVLTGLMSPQSQFNGNRHLDDEQVKRGVHETSAFPGNSDDSAPTPHTRVPNKQPAFKNAMQQTPGSMQS